MAKIRVFALAKELGLESKALVAVLEEVTGATATAASSLEDETANQVREHVRQMAERARVEQQAKAAAAAAAAPRRAIAAVAGPDFLDDVLAEATKAEAAQRAQAAAAKAAAAPQPAEAAPVVGEQPKPRPRPRPRPRREAEPEVGPPPEVEGAEPARPRLEREEREERPEADEEVEMRELERELQRLEREDRRRKGLIALEELTPEEREAERRRGADELAKPLPERAKRPVGERPPNAIDTPIVVTVLGHVDHGKTTLLDAIRNTQVTATEHGGITQHIGASEVEVGGRRFVLLDTPGHAAFTAMRARGAMVTDIAVLVVAADDGVMPQTVEAISHVKAAGVPIVVALTKMDLPNANKDFVLQGLAQHELVPEAWGGDTVIVELSAVRGEGLGELLEMVDLVAHTRLAGRLWADPEAPLVGVVVESKLDSSRGPVATMIVRNGSLTVADSIVCGTAYGRVKRMADWQGRPLREVEAGRPVEVVGLSEVPEAGEIVEKASSLKAARQLAEERQVAEREDRLEARRGILLSEIFRQLQDGTFKQLNLVVKADVWGSVQAVSQSLRQLNEELDEVTVNIVHSGVGEISESDVLLAVASDGLVIGFHVEADAMARQTADAEHVELRFYNVIYECIEDVREAMYGELEPVFEEIVLGRAQVRTLFRISRIGVVAGCMVTEGYLERGAPMRALREGEVVFEGTMDSLRHIKDDVRRVDAGTECGVSNRSFRGWQEGDIIECRGLVEVPRERRPSGDPSSRSEAMRVSGS